MHDSNQGALVAGFGSATNGTNLTPDQLARLNRSEVLIKLHCQLMRMPKKHFTFLERVKQWIKTNAIFTFWLGFVPNLQRSN